ncbi:MAG: LemA family protein [Verrucomicrobia bacterium]|nr:LemA family protein [Verrucomicrobiota bacterium]
MAIGIGLIAFFILLLVVIVLVVYAVSLYNSLVRLRNQNEKAWSNIDVLLKQRADMLPNLVETCKGYMQHERGTFEAVTNARSSWQRASTRGEQIEANNQIAGALKSLFAVAENYPELKANQNFLQLQATIQQIENQIAVRRESYNDAANVFNTTIQQFPNLIVARMLAYQPAPYFKVEEADRAAPKVSFA